MTTPFLSASWYRVAGVRLGLRSHVRVHRHRYRGRAWYVLQDPILGRSHRITAAAYAVVARMDGCRTLDEIWSDIATLLAEEAPTQDDLIRLVGQLHGADLIQGDVPVDGIAMATRLQRQERARLLRMVANPLSIRLPLWDPNTFLGRTLFLARPAIAWIGLAVWLPVVVAALVLATMNWTALTENLSDRILSPTSLALLALVYPIAKLLHELGHGYAARAFGAEVHEAGIMLLVGYPVPYVDASGASAFRSKRQRILVGAAGMLVEVFVAALALMLWLAVEPGLVRTLLFNVVVIAGVSTVLFNANPLLRYDGYYILSDLIEIPNFGIRANAYWSYLVERRLFGAEAERPTMTRGECGWYLAYGPASYAYRLFIGLSLALFVATQFFFVGAALAIWSAVSSLVLPVVRGLRHVLASPRLADRRRRAVAITFGSLAVLLLVAGFAPLPLWTHVEGVLWLPEAAHVRARGSGFVRAVSGRSGVDVPAGAPVLVLEDVILEAEIATIRARFEEAEIRYNAERFQDRSKAEVTRIERDTVASELERALDRQRRLTTTSPTGGRLVIPGEQDLPGRFVREGEVVAYVVPDGIETIRTSIPQDDIDLVRANLRTVRVRVAGALDRALPAWVARAVPAGRDELPSRALGTSGGGQIGVDPRDKTGLRTLQRSFQIDLQLAEAIPAGGFGARAYIRFEHEPEPAARQIYRRVRQLFLARFDV